MHGNLTCSEASMPSARSWLSVSVARLATSASYAFRMSRAINATGPRCSVVSSASSHKFPLGSYTRSLDFHSSPARLQFDSKKCASRCLFRLRTWIHSRDSLSLSEESLDAVLSRPVFRALKHRIEMDLQHLFANGLVSDMHQPLPACIAAFPRLSSVPLLISSCGKSSMIMSASAAACNSSSSALRIPFICSVMSAASVRIESAFLWAFNVSRAMLVASAPSVRFKR